MEALVAVAIAAFGLCACYVTLSKCVAVVRKAETAAKDTLEMKRAAFERQSGFRADLGPLDLDRLDPDVREWKKWSVAK